MKEIKFKFIKLLLYNILISCICSNPQVATAQNKTSFVRKDYLSDNKKRDSLDVFVDSLLKKYMQDPEVAGISIGISKGGQNYFYNYGEIKKQSAQLATTASIYEIGALTTGFTGFLLAQAVLEKKINPEADIRTYLPGNFPALEINRTPILIKHLANHTSGLVTTPEDLKSVAGFDSLNPYASYSKEIILSYLKNTKLKSVPGAKSDYSNLGMAVLGIVLEEVYKKSFSDLVLEKIAVPLGLKNTGIGLTEEQTKKLCSGYDQDGNATPAWTLGGFEAAGALKSSTEDLLTFLNYLLNEKEKLAQLILQPTFNGRPKMAMTWYLSQTKKKTTLVSQSGGTYGFGAFNGLISEKKCAVVILSNTNRSLDYLAIALFNYLQK